jgi:hypothetical protein
MKLPRLTTLLALLALPAPILAAGGRCSGSWNTKDCICIDHNACVNTYGGRAIQGSPGNWPCPNDPDNVWGCSIIDNCPGFGPSTGCVWREGCPLTIFPGN